MATTKNLGIQKLELADRAHDPRAGHESRDHETTLREAIDDAFQLVDDNVGLGGVAVQFSASNAADWAGALPPTTVAAALNRLAAALAVSGSFP